MPKRFLPAKYDYHRPVVPREVAEGVLDSSASAPTDVETGDGGELQRQLCCLLEHLKGCVHSHLPEVLQRFSGMVLMS